MADDLPTLQFRLAEARLARHKLAIGDLPNEIEMQDGSGTKFNAANADRLDQYIADLEREVAALQGAPRRTGPLQMMF